jgi:multisubunit Na+/H+ antiporter MnhB subunit
VIDAIWVPTSVHFWVGTLVVVASLAALAAAAYHGVRNRTPARWAHGLFILAQLTLAAQALIGIKLLDQGLGPLQLYIHYVGGLGPLLFYLLYYWLPAPFRARRWSATLVTGSAFAFALMAYAIGESYDPAAA